MEAFQGDSLGHPTGVPAPCSNVLELEILITHTCDSRLENVSVPRHGQENGKCEEIVTTWE